MTTPFLIRPGEPSDVPAVIELVRQLAVFEQLPGPDEGAAERLAEHAFGPHPRVELLVADEQGSVAAYAAYFITYSTFLAQPSLYLEDLFVRPTSRRIGIGAAFLRELARIAKARDCGRFEWAVLDWNIEAQQFYQSLGARLLPEWRICRVEGQALNQLAGVPSS
jgi:GNAT superfamily N-acetyltransferase